MIHFFAISYNLTEKWNLDIDNFIVLTYCNFPNFSLFEKCYKDNQTKVKLSLYQSINLNEAISFKKKTFF